MQETVDALGELSDAGLARRAPSSSTRCASRSSTRCCSRPRRPSRSGLAAAGVAADLAAVGVRAARRRSAACSARRDDHAERVALERAQDARSLARACRRSPLPAARRGHRGRRHRGARRRAHRAGDALMAARSGSTAAAGAAQAPAPRPTHRHRRPAGRPGDPDHRLLRLRRRRQDHDCRRPRACARPRPGAASSCSPSTRPAGWPSRSGLTELDNTPRPVAGVDDDGRRIADAMMLDMKRTFDEVVEAHATPDKAAADPGQPLLPGGLQLVRGHAGVHGHGEARPAARRGRARGHLGPHRRRHPAVPVGAGLPRRPQAARLLPRRPVHPAAHGPGQGRRPGLPQGVLRRRHDRRDHDVQGARRPAARRTCRPSSPPSTRCSAASASAPTSPTPCSRSPSTAFVVVAAPERDALREASYFVDRLESEGMPLAGVVVNRMQTLAAPAPERQPRARRPPSSSRTVGDSRRPTTTWPGSPRRCCACTPTSPRWPPGTTGTCAGSWPGTPGCRCRRCRRAPRTSTTSRGCARSAPPWPPAEPVTRRRPSPGGPTCHAWLQGVSHA